MLLFYYYTLKKYKSVRCVYSQLRQSLELFNFGKVLNFAEVLFAEVLFAEVLFAEVLFAEVLFPEVLFPEVLFAEAI